MTLWQQIQYRAKAILAGLGLAIVGLAEWVISAPDTANVIEKVVPAPWDQLVPIVLGGIMTALVHQVPNATPTASEPVEPPTQTTINRVLGDSAR